MTGGVKLTIKFRGANLELTLSNGSYFLMESDSKINKGAESPALVRMSCFANPHIRMSWKIGHSFYRKDRQTNKLMKYVGLYRLTCSWFQLL